MTALEEYARLETAGVWRPSPEEQGVNVTVSFGDASLVMSDMAGRVLSHWSLAAVERVNPGAAPALYAPSAEAGETLEIADEDMVKAVERVRSALASRRPKRGALRRVLLWGSAAALIAAAVFWLPDALMQHTVRVAPEPVRADVGGQVFRAITRVAGAPCRTRRGDQALAKLHNRLIAPAKGGLLVLPQAIDGAVSLPGGLIILNKTLVEDYENPDVVAGYILAETARQEDPLERLLNYAGLRETLRLLTTGHIAPEVLEAYGEALLAAKRAPVPEADLLRVFQENSVSSTPYAYALDVSGEATLGLIEADPVRSGGARAVLEDRDWVALQGICGE